MESARAYRDELASAHWFKSSRSNTGLGCVEVAHLSDVTAVRDSKDPEGPALIFTPHEWECFVSGAQSREFDRS